MVDRRLRQTTIPWPRNGANQFQAVTEGTGDVDRVAESRVQFDIDRLAVLQQRSVDIDRELTDYPLLLKTAPRLETAVRGYSPSRGADVTRCRD